MGKKKGNKGTTVAWQSFAAQSETVTSWADEESFPTLSQAAKYEEPKRATVEQSAPAAASRDAPAPREERYERTERRDNNSNYERRDNYERRGGYGGGDRDSHHHNNNYERRGGYGGGDREHSGYDRRDNNRDFGRRDNNYDRRGGYGGGDRDNNNSFERRGGFDRDNRESGDSFRRRDDRRDQPREKREIPTSPPYTAYVGNLAYGIIEADLENFFKEQGLTPLNIRLVRDRETERLKGYGYVEFENVEDLKKALAMTEILFQDRNLKIDVATGKQEMRGRSDAEKDWRSAARSQDDLPTRTGNYRGDREGGRGGDREGRSFEGRSSYGGYNRNRDRDAPREGEQSAPRAEPQQRSERSSAPKSNPFGGARPRDEVLAERQKQNTQN